MAKTLMKTLRLDQPASGFKQLIALVRNRHLGHIAREHMGLGELNMEIVIAEARGYLGRARAEYDLIVEDVFAGGEDGLDKPPGFPRPGLFLAASRLARGGLLVANTVHDGLETEDVLKERFRSVVRFEIADCTNEVYVATDERLSARDLRRAIASEPLLKPALELEHEAALR